MTNDKTAHNVSNCINMVMAIAVLRSKCIDSLGIRDSESPLVEDYSLST
jgi:hypothetical protein